MKKKKLAINDPRERRLINLERRGTIIVGEYRCGSHFVQYVCQEVLERSGVACRAHEEMTWLAGSTQEQMRAAADDSRYHLMVCNQSSFKLAFLDSPEMLDDWHVIRIVHDDRYRWFISWYFYISKFSVNWVVKEKVHARLNGRSVWFFGDNESGHYYDHETGVYVSSWSTAAGSYQDPDMIGCTVPPITSREIVAGLYHHDTQSGIYQQWQKNHGIFPFNNNMLLDLMNALNIAAINAMIPADETIAYSELPLLQTSQNRWLPNQYPDFDVERDFSNGSYINAILDRWTNVIPGKFKGQT